MKAFCVPFWLGVSTGLTNHCAERLDALLARVASLEGELAECRIRCAHLEDFVHTAAHDLREPLRAIQSYVELVKQSDAVLDERSERFLKYAAGGAARARLLVDTLALAEPDSGCWEPVDLQTVVDDVLIDYRLLVEESQAQVTVEGLRTVWSKRIPLRLIIQNLLENAIRFRSARPLEVKITARAESGRLVELSVRDNGRGIDVDKLEGLFEAGVSVASGGRGMGLAIVRRAVDELGGETALSSRPGEGSAVTVRFKGEVIE